MSAWQYEGAEQKMGVRRAALVVEMNDGSKMLYEFRRDSELTMQVDTLVEELFGYDFIGTHVPATSSVMTVRGTFEHGTIWTGDVPQSHHEHSIERLPGAALEM